MYDFLLKGGPVVIPIGILSVVALAVFLERLWSLKRGRIIPEGFIQRIEELVGSQRIGDALLLCQESQDPMAKIMEAA